MTGPDRPLTNPTDRSQVTGEGNTAAQLRANADLAEKSLDFLDGDLAEETLADIALWRAAADALDAMRADLGAIAHIAANPAKPMNALDGIGGIARAALGVEAAVREQEA